MLRFFVNSIVFRFGDGLIVASALASGATILYSEDMHDGLTIEGITIVKPFPHTISRTLTFYLP